MNPITLPLLESEPSVEKIVETALERLQAGGIHLVEAELSPGVRLPAFILEDVETLLALPDRPNVAFVDKVYLDDLDCFYIVEGAQEFSSTSSSSRSQGPEFETMLNVESRYDLRKFQPRLTKLYKAHSKTCALLDLYAPYEGGWVSLTLTEGWYEEIEVLEAQAKAKAEDYYQDALISAHTSYKQKIKVHFEALDDLNLDTRWLTVARKKTSTLRALMVCVNELAPSAVAAIGERRVKEYIGDMAERLRQELPTQR
jgi:hypothetical protein